MVELSGVCTYGEKAGFAGAGMMRAHVRERKKEVDSTNYVCVIGMQSFFSPPSTSSKDVTTRLHAVPPISPPSLLFSLISPLSSIAHSPVLRRHQQEKARYCSRAKALRLPPLLVRCHSTQCPLLPQIVIVP